MALAALKTWVAAEVLTAADLNAERDNILNNALSLISPLTGSLAAGGNDLTGLDEVAFNDAAANASATRRLRANAANLTWHDGTAAGRMFYAGGTDVPVADGGTGAGTFTTDGVLYGAGTSAISVTAQGGTRTILTANVGAPAWSAAPIINTSVQIGVVSSTTGSLSLANSASANLTTLRAGNATEANTYVWPVDGGAANQVLTTDGATPTTTLSWAAAGTTGFTVVNTTFANASGNVAVTGAGFTPRAVMFYGSDPDDRFRRSTGWASSTTARFAQWSRSSTVAGYQTILLYRVGDGTDELSGDLVSLDSDGATFSRVVTGLGQALDISIVFFR